MKILYYLLWTLSTLGLEAQKNQNTDFNKLEKEIAYKLAEINDIEEEANRLISRSNAAELEGEVSTLQANKTEAKINRQLAQINRIEAQVHLIMEEANILESQNLLSKRKVQNLTRKLQKEMAQFKKVSFKVKSSKRKPAGKEMATDRTLRLIDRNFNNILSRL